MIEVKEIYKKFEDNSGEPTNALLGVNMNIKKGSIYGLVGANGSGKTTLLKHLVGLYLPDSGSISIDDELFINNPQLKERISFISDDLFFFRGYSCKKLKTFYKSMYKKFNEERYEKLVELLGVNPKRSVGRFSKGMQKQVAFIFAMCTMPDILVLDEPIDGLDPLVRINIFNEIIDDVAERGTTVIVSSHNLKEMDGICDWVGIIKGGRMLKEAELDSLKQEYTTTETPSLDEIFVKIYSQDDQKIDKKIETIEVVS